MDIVEFRNYLIKFNYPNIHHMSEDEVSDIFHASNRIFLLCWLVQIIEPTFILDMHSKETPELLADFVYRNGFCLASQKNAFIHSDLDTMEQLLILKKMFESVIDENLEDLPDETMSIDTLESYVKSATPNLFPELGPVKSVNCKKHINELRKEIADTTRKITEIEKEIKEETEHHECDDLQNVQELFEQSSERFHLNSSLLSQKKNDFHKCSYGFRGSTDALRTTDEKFEKVLKMIQNTKAIGEFPKLNKEICLQETNGTYKEASTIIRDSACLCNDEL